MNQRRCESHKRKYSPTFQSVCGLSAFAALAALMMVFMSGRAAADRGNDRTEKVEVSVPLDDGRIDIADLLRDAVKTTGVEPNATLRELSWPVNVRSALGRAQLRAIERLTDSMITIEVGDYAATLTLDQQALRRRVGAARGWIDDVLDLQQTRPRREFGMYLERRNGATQPIDARSNLPRRVVVLVHGLDDPGWLWSDTIDALHERDYTVVRFEYPNDGAISDAADLLALKLQTLRSAGVQRVDLVAHSMGGLVCRDVLTRRAFYNGDGAGGDVLPAVDRLIMLGTPNHGSNLVRLRAISEIQEQLSRAMNGNGSWLDWTSDGNGEAAVDLTPGSTYLTRLNRRDLPTHTTLTIVAGRWSGVDEVELERLTDVIGRVASSDIAPKWLRDWSRQLSARPMESALQGLVNGLGDGAVSIESTRLTGVDDHVIIPANHLSMIVNAGDEPAPAIPIVLDRLDATQDRSGETESD